MVKDINLVVAVPSNGFWTATSARCMALMFSYFERYKIRGVNSQKISLIGTEGSLVHASRERIMQKALQYGVSHLLFIDSDMKFPMQTAHGLLAADKDYVAANCTTRRHPVEALAMDFEGRRISSNGKTGLEKVRSVGAAISLIRLEVVKGLTPPLFLSDWIPSEQDFCGEDIYFTQKLAAAGVDLWIDHDLSKLIGHVGQYTYGHWDLEDYEGEKHGEARG